jgi:hypothetical protein
LMVLFFLPSSSEFKAFNKMILSQMEIKCD